MDPKATVNNAVTGQPLGGPSSGATAPVEASPQGYVLPTDAESALSSASTSHGLVPGIVVESGFRKAWLKPLVGAGVGVGALALVWIFFSGHGASHGNGEGQPNRSASIPVRTLHPKKKVLQRMLTLPVSIKPAAQSELYAKTSGYLKAIQREWTLPVLIELNVKALSQALPVGPHPAWAFLLAQDLHLGYSTLPEKDIGSRVIAGERLLDIDAPEQFQDIAEKTSILEQRRAELAAAEMTISTFEAALEAAKAQRGQAATEVQRAMEEHRFRAKQLSRLESLVKDGTIVADVLDEKVYQAKAAESAWESTKAKFLSIEADIKVSQSKLLTAKADVRVKAALVQVARDGLQRARVMADYAHIYAPFNGVITYRGVDVGDFVQNSTSGQTRHLMTVASVDNLVLVAQVPERDAPWVKTGTEATLHDIDALESVEMKGKVARISGSLDAKSRTMQVEIDLPNKDGRLFPGMYGQVTLNLQNIENAYSIPSTAIFSRKGVNYIILVNDGIAKRQPIRIRYDDGRELEVVKLIGEREVPLTSADEVIVSNKGEIADGQAVAPLH